MFSWRSIRPVPFLVPIESYESFRRLDWFAFVGGETCWSKRATASKGYGIFVRHRAIFVRRPHSRDHTARVLETKI